jgi:sterol O-acyltransferase
MEGLSLRPPLSTEDSWAPNASSELMDVDGASQLRPQDAEQMGDSSRSRSTTAIPSDDSDSDTQPIKEPGNRRKSIQVVLEQSGKKGEYTFTAKDPIFHEVLKSGLRREAEKLNGKTKKPRDLVFTQQFTTFDRQNTSTAHSPFHGFFTLFWIAMALLFLRIAAGNYRTKGSVFGDAEILHLMIDRDLFVMLTTDVAMCAATSFGFFLHKAISYGYLTWNGSGWFIQSIWQTFFTCTIIWVTFWRDWSWTHTVFIVLHVFVLLMKQHAYTFYNGYCTWTACTFATQADSKQYPESIEGEISYKKSYIN